MKLSMFTDYSLRVLMYAAAHEDQLITTKEVGAFYNISYHHLVKVVHKLSQNGFIQIRKGNGGGFQLALPPSEINIGKVVRAMEPDFELVECFGCTPSSCAIVSYCTLKGELRAALNAFLKSLDQVALSDLASNHTKAFPPKAG